MACVMLTSSSNNSKALVLFSSGRRCCETSRGWLGVPHDFNHVIRSMSPAEVVPDDSSTVSLETVGTREGSNHLAITEIIVYLLWHCVFNLNYKNT